MSKCQTLYNFQTALFKNSISSCSAAIIAVPPHKVLDICFRPPLPKEKVEILENVVVGQTTRFVVAYKEVSSFNYL